MVPLTPPMVIVVASEFSRQAHATTIHLSLASVPNEREVRVVDAACTLEIVVIDVPPILMRVANGISRSPWYRILTYLYEQTLYTHRLNILEERL